MKKILFTILIFTISSTLLFAQVVEEDESENNSKKSSYSSFLTEDNPLIDAVTIEKVTIVEEETSTGPEWEWTNYVNAYSIHEECIVLDKLGNSYIIGYFSGSASFDEHKIHSKGKTDIFIAKIDADGKWQWAIRAGGKAYDSGEGISIDNAGNIFVTGYFNKSGKFGKKTLRSGKYRTLFVGKINSNGEWQWVKKSAGKSQGNGIATDNEGNNYICGALSGKVKFGSYSCKMEGYEQWGIFVAKINTEGEWQWTTMAEISYSINLIDIAIDSYDNIYIYGDFKGMISFGDFRLSSGGRPYKSSAFVAKLDKNGKWKWAEDAYGRRITTESFTVDRNGNSYVTGSFIKTANFGSYSVTSYENGNAFIAKLSNDGKWQWVTQTGGYRSSCLDISMNNSRNIFVTGSFDGDNTTFGSNFIPGSQGFSGTFIAELDESGKWMGVISAGGKEFDEGSGINICDDNSIITVGKIFGTASLGDYQIETDYEASLFLTKLQKKDFDSIKAINPISNEKKEELQEQMVDLQNSNEYDPYVSPFDTKEKIEYDYRSYDLSGVASKLRKDLENGYEVLVFEKGIIDPENGLSVSRTFYSGEEYSVIILTEDRYPGLLLFLTLNFEDDDYHNDLETETLKEDNIIGTIGVLVAGKAIRAEIRGWSNQLVNMPGYLIIARKQK